jgi:hypothetical protein
MAAVAPTCRSHGETAITASDYAFVDAGRNAERAPELRASSSDAGALEPCHDELHDELARLSCDGEEILVQRPLELHPLRSAPTEPTKSVLAAVGALLRGRKEILLVRIEVRSALPARNAEAARQAVLESQARADALLKELWRRHGVSPERLEAVGLGQASTRARDGARWPVVLRVLQRARQ